MNNISSALKDKLRPLVRRFRPLKEEWAYRKVLFQELSDYLGDKPLRILEIGAKDFVDTRRLLTLNPKTLTLVDLPGFEDKYAEFLNQAKYPGLEYLSANLMYDQRVNDLSPYNLVWCTGVLYHNPEQLRMVRKLYDLLTPGGVLVLESATTRHPKLIHENAVEIVHPMTEELKKKYRISTNVSHLPSKKAMKSWLELVGFEKVVKSNCYSSTSRALDRTRGAFFARKPLAAAAGRYYTIQSDGFEIGKSI
jgi:SAM-dependent methyltransferase